MWIFKPEITELGLSTIIVPVRVIKKGGKSKIKVSSQEARSQNTNLAKLSFSPFLPNQKQKRLMLSKAMEVAVKACFRNHLYQFEGIGLRLSEEL